MSDPLRLVVFQLGSGEIVRTIPMPYSNAKTADKALMGLLRNMDLEKYSAEVRGQPDTTESGK